MIKILKRLFGPRPLPKFNLDPICLSIGLSNVVGLAFGQAEFKVGEPILVCTVDGCMAEILTPKYGGIVKEKISYYDIPAIRVEVVEAVENGPKVGTEMVEFVSRLRRLSDGMLIAAN